MLLGQTNTHFMIEVGIGGIIKFNRFPGKLDREVVAIGIRNSVGHAFNPKDGNLYGLQIIKLMEWEMKLLQVS